MSRRAFFLLLPATLLVARLDAQERLAARRTITLGPAFEMWSFGDGIPQPLAAGGTASITRVTELSIPVVATQQLAERFRMGVSAAFASASVTTESPNGGQGGSKLSVSGLTDVKISFGVQLVPDRVIATLGFNAPTGLTELDPEQLDVIRVIAAPALAAQVPSLGTGRAVTGGIVLAQQLGGRAWAFGASYEARGSFAPVGTASGVPTPEFTPSDVFHLSLSSDGLVGRHGMTFGVSADVFSDDKLRFDGASDDATSRLGPVITADWQLRVGATRFRELTISLTDRYRTSYRVGGETIPGSSGNYLDADVTAVSGMGERMGLVTSLAVRQQTGLSSDESLVSASALAGAVTLGLQRVAGIWITQPFIRLQLGRLESGASSATMTGVGAGIAVTARF